MCRQTVSQAALHPVLVMREELCSFGFEAGGPVDVHRASAEIGRHLPLRRVLCDRSAGRCREAGPMTALAARTRGSRVESIEVFISCLLVVRERWGGQPQPSPR